MRVVWTDDISIGVWKSVGAMDVMRLAKTKKMPDKWRISILVPIYKNLWYFNLSKLSLIKFRWNFGSDIEQLSRKGTFVLENRFGFILGRLTEEAIYLLRSLM